MQEIWKDIKDYEGLYQISNFGNVKSFPRKGTHKNKERILKQYKNHKGYFYTVLTKNSKGKQFFIHRLIAIHFIENPLNKPQVNHINGIKTDNSIKNLEWVSGMENMQHSWKIGLRDIEKVKKTLYEANRREVNQFSLNGNFIKKWESIKDIERTLNFDNRNISACCRHKRKTAYGYIWRYVEEC